MSHEKIFREVTGKFILGRIVGSKRSESLGGGMKIGASASETHRFVEILEAPEDLGKYKEGDYVVALPSRKVDNFDLLGQDVTYVHPDDILGILNEERRLQVQESFGLRDQQRTS